LLNESLRRVLGPHVRQQGSFVGDEYLRFDFNHYQNLTEEEILSVEDMVNGQIREGFPVAIYELPFKEAQKMNVQAVFGEKYDEIVRVVDTVFSKELCGGCHVANTADIGGFAIYNIESKGSGIFRIEAATGDAVKTAVDSAAAHLKTEIRDLATKAEKILTAAREEDIKLEFRPPALSAPRPGYRYLINLGRDAAAWREAARELDKTYQKSKREKNAVSLDNYLKNVLTIGDYNVLIITTEGMDVEQQKDLADRLSDKLPSSIVFIANIVAEKVVFVSKNKIDKLHAGETVRLAAGILGGGGGGRKDFAQAGGRDAARLAEAVAAVRTMITERL
jgi:alanyl-tRNA synthetase